MDPIPVEPDDVNPCWACPRPVVVSIAARAMGQEVHGDFCAHHGVDNPYLDARWFRLAGDPYRRPDAWREAFAGLEAFQQVFTSAYLSESTSEVAPPSVADLQTAMELWLPVVAEFAGRTWSNNCAPAALVRAWVEKWQTSQQ